MPVDERPSRYPLTLDARLERPSRGLWLVKWFLLIPHYVVLALLLVGLAVTWVAALVAIVATGRYPRPLFDYAVGVLRWSWRVAAYGYGAAGTDRYPPFTLADAPDYPARLDIPYPDHLSRGLALVKWWLLAIPHYVVTSLLYGGVVYWTFDRDGADVDQRGLGVIGLLVLVAVIVLLFRGSYPRSLFDLVVGLQRWGFRVAAYALLLTDAYPPFRLDLGGTDPGHPSSAAWPGQPAQLAGPGRLAEPGRAGQVAQPAPVRPPERWTAGRLAALVAGALLVLCSGALLLGAGGTALADRTARDPDGYLTTATAEVAAAGYAVTTQEVDVPGAGEPAWPRPSWVLGTVRVRVHGHDPARPVFVGVARRADVDRYLAGVPHARLTRLDDGVPSSTEVPGSTAPAPPTAQAFWIAGDSGTTPVAVTWPADQGPWVVVLMNADGSAGVRADADLAATLPVLGRITAGLAIAGGVLLALGALAMVLALRTAPGSATRPPVPTGVGGPA